jgi:hypothetical protein
VQCLDGDQIAVMKNTADAIGPAERVTGIEVSAREGA